MGGEWTSSQSSTAPSVALPANKLPPILYIPQYFTVNAAHLPLFHQDHQIVFHSPNETRFWLPISWVSFKGPRWPRATHRWEDGSTVHFRPPAGHRRWAEKHHVVQDKLGSGAWENMKVKLVLWAKVGRRIYCSSLKDGAESQQWDTDPSHRAFPRRLRVAPRGWAAAPCLG